MWRTWELEVNSNLTIKWDWNVFDLICSLGATPFNGDRVSPSEQNQLLSLSKFSLVQSSVSVSSSAPEGWGLTPCPCRGPRDVARGKAQEGFMVPALQCVPGHSPLKSSKWDMGVLNASWSQQVFHPLQHHPSFMPECTNPGCPGGWSVAGT